jgi:hypothetical protein
VEPHAIIGSKRSDETRKQMSDSSDSKKGQPRPVGSEMPSQQIEVTDSELNIITNYNSIREAARACPASL